jgi:hypothetical protein
VPENIPVPFAPGEYVTPCGSGPSAAIVARAWSTATSKDFVAPTANETVDALVNLGGRAAGEDPPSCEDCPRAPAAVVKLRAGVVAPWTTRDTTTRDTTSAMARIPAVSRAAAVRRVVPAEVRDIYLRLTVVP